MVRKGHRKIPIRWLQGDSKIPLEPFLSRARKARNNLIR